MATFKSYRNRSGAIEVRFRSPPAGRHRAKALHFHHAASAAAQIDELRELISDLGLLHGRSAAEAARIVAASFSAADTDGDMALSESEFAIFYRHATAPRLADLLEAEHPEEVLELQGCFAAWAAFGGDRSPGAERRPPGLASSQFVKLCRDTGLVGGQGGLAPADADIIFTRVKARGSQRLSFAQFVDALGLVAARRGADVLLVLRQVTASDGPALNGTLIQVERFADDGGAQSDAQRRAPGGARPDARRRAPGGAPPPPAFTIPARRAATPDLAAERLQTPEAGGAAPGACAKSVLRVYLAFAGFGAGSPSGGAGKPPPDKV
jgi:hypothetical protein